MRRDLLLGAVDLQVLGVVMVCGVDGLLRLAIGLLLRSVELRLEFEDGGSTNLVDGAMLARHD